MRKIMQSQNEKLNCDGIFFIFNDNSIMALRNIELFVFFSLFICVCACVAMHIHKWNILNWYRFFVASTNARQVLWFSFRRVCFQCLLHFMMRARHDICRIHNFFSHLSRWSWHKSRNLKCGCFERTQTFKPNRIDDAPLIWWQSNFMKCLLRFYDFYSVLFAVRHSLNFFISSFLRSMGAKVWHWLFVPWISMYVQC